MTEAIILEAPMPPLVLEAPPKCGLHFSDLKRMSRSAMHVHHALTSSDREPTRDMRIGTIVHHLVCGPHNRRPLLRFDGERRAGHQWERFKAQASPLAEIVTAPEWAEAEPIALAVLADPVASELIRGSRREVALSWDDAGIACETDGIDGVNDRLRSIWDLKCTHTSEPSEFSRLATRMHYHAQMAWMERGALANKIPTDGGVHLIAVEATAPYPVTVLECVPSVLEAGNRHVTLWLERYRVCRDADAWPGYVQRIVPFELPSWEGGEDEDD